MESEDEAFAGDAAPLEGDAAPGANAAPDTGPGMDVDAEASSEGDADVNPSADADADAEADADTEADASTGPDASLEPDVSLFHDRSRTEMGDRNEVIGLCLDRLSAIDREIAALEAQRAEVLVQSRVLSEAASDAPQKSKKDSTARDDSLGFTSFVAEVALARRVPERTARNQIEEATTLIRQLPETRDALWRGEISYAHARGIIKQSWSLPNEAVEGYEQAVLPVATRQTSSQFARTARITRERIHPESIKTRRQAAEEERCVDFEPVRDGMAWVGVKQTAERATAIYNATIDVARRMLSPEDPRTLPQMAADVFADAIIAGFADPKPGADLEDDALIRCASSEEGEPEVDVRVGRERDAADVNMSSGAGDGCNEVDALYPSDLLVSAEASSLLPDGSPSFAPVVLEYGEVTATAPNDSGSVWARDPGLAWARRLPRKRMRARSGEPASSESSPDESSSRGRYGKPRATMTLPPTLGQVIDDARAERRSRGLPAVEVKPGQSLFEAHMLAIAPRIIQRLKLKRNVGPAPCKTLRSGLGVAQRPSIRPTVMVTVPIMSLLGNSEAPATLDGYGPIDADAARDLAANAPSLMRLLTHPETGAVLSVGRESYRVPADLRRALLLRDRTCRFPGCNHQAQWCDADHSKDWQWGGETDIRNLAFLCRKHHRLKHKRGWDVELHPDGRMTWTSPRGRVYESLPAAVITKAGRSAREFVRTRKVAFTSDDTAEGERDTSGRAHSEDSLAVGDSQLSARVENSGIGEESPPF